MEMPSKLDYSPKIKTVVKSVGIKPDACKENVQNISMVGGECTLWISISP